MTWTIGDVLEQTVRSFGRNWVALVVGNLVATLISFLPMALCADGKITAVDLYLTQGASKDRPVALDGAVGLRRVSGGTEGA